MKKKNNHFQSDNNLNDTGQLCEKKTNGSGYVIFSWKKVRLARFCPKLFGLDQNIFGQPKTILTDQKCFGAIEGQDMEPKAS